MCGSLSVRALCTALCLRVVASPSALSPSCVYLDGAEDTVKWKTCGDFPEFQRASCLFHPHVRLACQRGVWGDAMNDVMDFPRISVRQLFIPSTRVLSVPKRYMRYIYIYISRHSRLRSIFCLNILSSIFSLNELRWYSDLTVKSHVMKHKW